MSIICLACRKSAIRRLTRSIQTAPNSAQSNLDAALEVLPKFHVSGNQVEIFSQPTQLHDWLMKRIRSAKKRIFFSTLYLGKEERNLVRALHESLSTNKDLQFHYIADILRSTREQPGPSSALLLSTLKTDFPDRVHLSFYHTPALSGLRKSLVPRRFDEGWGLWHAKLYGVDDDVLLSGANLSRDYFTNRQDRYMLVKSCPSIADYCQGFVKLGQRLSYPLQPSNPAGVFFGRNEVTDSSRIGHFPNSFRSKASAMVREFQDSWISSSPLPSSSSDTHIRPFMQFGQLGVHEETELVIPHLFDLANEHNVGRIDFTSGYFATTEDKQERMLRAKVDELRVICAAPQANGFYNSAGVSKYIPTAYTRAEQRFYQAAIAQNMQDKLALREWSKPNWTYHAKGIWLTAKNSIDKPFATVIGSSNYGPRSAKRDSELNFLVTTTDEDLRQRLGQEVAHLWQHTEAVDASTFRKPERIVSPGVRLAAWMIKDMF